MFGAVLLFGATALLGGDIVAAPPSTEAQTTTTLAPPTTTVAPSATLPQILLPNPTAEVRLGCGSSSSTRSVLAFVNNAPADRPTSLLLATRLEDGSYRHDRQVIVGDETPANPVLFWHVPGVLEGPWQVDSVIDACSDAGAGSVQARDDSLPVTGANRWVAALATGLLGAGMLLHLLSTWRGRATD